VNGCSGQKWGESAANTCVGETKPFFGSKYPEGALPPELVLEKVLRSMKNPAKLLDITALSQLRKDGHPSVYGAGGHRGLDCTHWCLPGVPDTWNVLLYAALFQN